MLSHLLRKIAQVEHQQEHQKTQGTVLLPLDQKGASTNPLLP